MACIYVSAANSGDDIKRLVIRDANHELHRPHSMPQPIQRLHKFPFLSCEVFRVFLLNVRGVCQHYRTKVAGRVRCPDCLAVPIRNQKWQSSGVVDVRVGKNDSIDFLDRNGKCLVLLGGLVSSALEHAAIEEHSVPVDVQHVARARYLTGCTYECDLQAYPSATAVR